MRFGVVVPTYGRMGDPGAVRALVAAAEDLGYDGAWFADHVVIPDYATTWVPPPQLEPLATCFVGLGATTRLRFGVDVLVAAYRHPLVLAAMAATAQLLGGGRLVLGIGVGYLEGEFAALGVPYRERGPLTDEALRILREAWSTPGALSHHGEFFSFEGVHVGVQPDAGSIPLWVGGNADRALRRAALLGDGWHPLWPSPERYGEARSHIEALRRDAGIDRPFTGSMSCPLGAVLDGAQDWEQVPERPAPPPARREYGYVPERPRAADGRPRFIGTPDQLADDVAAYAAVGVDHLVLRFWTSVAGLEVDGVIAHMRRFVDDVAPVTS